jgi:hypothetical protein
MRKHFLVCLVCLFSVLYTQAETLISTYTSTFFNKDFQIEASDKNDDNFYVFIQVANKEQDTKSQIRIEGKKMDAFLQALQQLRSEYVKWSKKNAAAYKNGDSMYDSGVSFPKVTIRWWNSEWIYSYNNTLEPKFLLLNDGRWVVSFANRAKGATNYLSDLTVYWIFASVQDFDQVLAKLSPSYLLPKIIDK